MTGSELEDCSNVSIIYSTFPDYEVAHKICNTLIEENLIGCANVLQNVSSIYKWDNEIKTDTECIAILKTIRHLEEEAILRIEEMHPYVTPAVFSLPVSKCPDRFSNWIGSLLETDGGH